MDWSAVSALIDGAGGAHLSTASASGEPHVSVVWAVRDGESIVMTMRTVSGKATNMRANPRVALMWEGNSAETYLWGNAELITDAAEKSALWESGIMPFDLSMFYGGPTTDDWTLVRIAPSRVVSIVRDGNGMQRRVWKGQHGNG